MKIALTVRGAGNGLMVCNVQIKVRRSNLYTLLVLEANWVALNQAKLPSV